MNSLLIKRTSPGHNLLEPEINRNAVSKVGHKLINDSGQQSTQEIRKIDMHQQLQVVKLGVGNSDSESLLMMCGK